MFFFFQAEDGIRDLVRARGLGDVYKRQDHISGKIRLDRRLFTATRYPHDYGFIDDTLGLDGDPLDALVLLDEPTFPGCIIEARPIGIFRMLDKGVADDKILAVPARDPIFTDYHDITDIPKHYLAEVGHFFEVYKDLEGMRTKPIGWENAAAAKTEILRAMKLYQDRFHMGGL